MVVAGDEIMKLDLAGELNKVVGDEEPKMELDGESDGPNMYPDGVKIHTPDSEFTTSDGSEFDVGWVVGRGNFELELTHDDFCRGVVPADRAAWLALEEESSEGPNHLPCGYVLHPDMIYVNTWENDGEEIWRCSNQEKIELDITVHDVLHGLLPDYFLAYET